MKKLTFFAIFSMLVIYANPSYSQSMVRGKILDIDNQPVPFANVVLLSAHDSTFVSGTTTSENGLFQLSVGPGNYTINLSMIGYRQVSKEISVGPGVDLNLGSIVFEEEIRILEDIVVKTEKLEMEYLPDRLVLNVKEKAFTSGSAVDVLERSPGVTLNRMGSDIQLMGKTGVTIMINGKESHVPQDALMQMLTGIDAQNIEKIELITNPDAKSDAEGNGGVINIVLKESLALGTNGSYSLTLGYGNREKTGLNLSLAHSTRKMDFLVNYSFLRDRTYQVFSNGKRVQLPTGSYEDFTFSERFPTQLNNNLRVGMDYRLSPKTTIGTTVSAYSNRWEMDATNESRFFEAGDTSFLTTENHEINRWDHFMVNGSLTHEFNSRQKIDLSFDYLYYVDNNPTNYLHRFSGGEDNFPEKVKSDKYTPIHFYVSNIDYQKTISERVSLEAGLKGAFSSFRNDVQVAYFEDDSIAFDPEFSQIHLLKENIGAGYLSFDIRFDRNINVTTGLRYERTYSYLQSDKGEVLLDRRYGNLFPGLMITKKWDELTQLHLSYQRRITRPTFNNMAPFVLFLDPKTFFSGNTKLLPSLSDAVKAAMNYRDLLVSVQYMYEEDPIATFQAHVIPGTTQQLIAAENLLARHTASAFLSLPVTISNWWQMQNSILINREWLRAERDGGIASFHQWSYQLNSTQTFRLPADLLMEMTGYYHSSSLYGTMEKEEAYNLNFGISRELEKGKGTLKFSMHNLFDFNDLNFRSRLPDEGGQLDMRYVFEPRVVRLTYVREFGAGQAKPSKRRNTGSEEEQQRIGN